MHFTKVLASTLFLLTSTLATPIEPRACAATCGSVCYNSADISNAVGDGYAKYKAGTTSNSYPHTYNNYEGFDFPVNGPYQEYPILSSYKDYSGGSPGADRVIFNTGGSLAGVITHTGASGNNFVGCSGSEGAHT